MPTGILFWVILVVYCLFGLMPPGPNERYFRMGGTLIIVILLALLGWHIFGPAVYDSGTSIRPR